VGSRNSGQGFSPYGKGLEEGGRVILVPSGVAATCVILFARSWDAWVNLGRESRSGGPEGVRPLSNESIRHQLLSEAGVGAYDRAVPDGTGQGCGVEVGGRCWGRVWKGEE